MKVVHEVDDETGALVETFNAMITEISTRDRARAHGLYGWLTGLANRQEFQPTRCASASGRAAKHMPPCSTDLDEFKSINDSYGYLAGDKLLIDVAANLKRECPDNLQIARLWRRIRHHRQRNATEEAAQAALAGMFASLSCPLKSCRGRS
jgi:predicted signal transduction protein with EAL and GGDEF domain